MKKSKKEIKNKGKHEFICDICGKPATYNRQEGSTTYKISKVGNFKPIYSDLMGENEFFCDKCAENEGIN